MDKSENSKKINYGEVKLTKEEAKVLEEFFHALAQIEFNVYKKGGTK